MAPRTKSLDEFQQSIEGQEPVEKTTSEPEVDERAVILVFDDHYVVEQFVSLVGATALEIDEKLDQGDEVALEITGKVQKSEIITRKRDRRDGGRDETVIIRKIKVDGAKLLRATSQML